MEQSNCLNDFLTKTYGLKELIKKIYNTDTVRTMRGQPLANTSNNSTCVVNFFISFY